MTEPTQDKLFEMAPLPTPIPELFGLRRGDYIIPGLRRYVELDVVPNSPYWYNADSMADDFISTAYLPGFDSWRAIQPDVKGVRTVVSGILAGFPVIRGRSGETAPGGEQGFIHTWANDTDIDAFSVVVPAKDVRELRVYSRQRTELELAADNAYDGLRRYKVPALFDTQTDTWIMRWATEAEIRTTAEQLFDLPTIQALRIGGEVHLQRTEEDPTTIYKV